MRIVPPGDDVCPVPPPVTESPPHDRFCDLVMTGGVASGVVYPWAIVELARAYRFRNIGGSSVGAMAAVLAAAAEYGRRVGFRQSFEVLRRAPAALGEVLPDQRTRMLSLFQANARGRRLVALWGRLGHGRGSASGAKVGGSRRGRFTPSGPARVVFEVARAYAWPIGLGAILGGILGLAFFGAVAPALPLAFIGLLAGLSLAFLDDLRAGVIDNFLGLCTGATLEAPGREGPRPGLTEWLHEGVQAGAGLKATDRPLTFRDLWSAPLTPGAPRIACRDSDPVSRRSINLQMLTTNVAHGRPYRLPVSDETSRLFYKPAEWANFFPQVVMAALLKTSRPYEKKNRADPDRIAHADEFRELPDGDLPIVVAARLSLSFPLLFSAVPLWAIDYEADRGQRQALKRCLCTDGGASSNFPLHMFDAALPRWPTFGFWLDSKDPERRPWRGDRDADVWLPEHIGEGWGDSWNRFDPAAAAAEPTRQSAGHGLVAQLTYLGGFLLGIGESATNWHDRTNMRLPHVRNRVARLLLGPGEGKLHIGMPREQILDMAHRYGTKSGRLFVDRFADVDGAVPPAWSEQRWVRLTVLLNGLRERLTELGASCAWSAHTEPMSRAIDRASREDPIREHVATSPLTAGQARSLADLIAELERLEDSLRFTATSFVQLAPTPELRARAPF